MLKEHNAYQQRELQMDETSCFPLGLSSLSALLSWVCAQLHETVFTASRNYFHPSMLGLTANTLTESLI